MSTDEIRKKLGQIASAPTPQNTPASLTGSYLKNNIPTIPTTISEDNEELHRKLLSNPALLSMIQGKLDTLVGQDSGYINKLPVQVKKRVYGLKSLQQRQFTLESEFQQELIELEKKYHDKYAPLFEKRKKIVTGDIEPSAEEIEEGKLLMDDNEKDNEDEEKDEDAEEEEDDEEESNEIKGIPSFWLTALENLTPIANTITERDVEILDNLIDIRMEYLDTPGFKLIFEFNEEAGEFFTNKNLTKTYYYQKELGYSGDFIYDHAEEK
ncbi:unnamed protein product [[Candida] boidinii]|nr:unnamed protein product [[Candida] boidinii]